MSKPMPKSMTETTTLSAVEMGARQREISVSEFFTKNRHLLGFDNPRKALLTCVKEAVDNALDACEEAASLERHPERTEVIAVRKCERHAGRHTGIGGAFWCHRAPLVGFERDVG